MGGEGGLVGVRKGPSAGAQPGGSYGTLRPTTLPDVDHHRRAFRFRDDGLPTGNEHRYRGLEARVRAP